jgi:hypothetical protein
MKRIVILATLVLLLSVPARAGVDLIIVNPKADPAAVKPLGSTFSINFDIRNIGNTGYSGALSVKVPLPSGAAYANSSYSSDGTMACGPQTGHVLCSRISGAAPLAPSGGTISMRVRMKAQVAGSYRIDIEADPDHVIAEDNESNNKASVNGSMSDLPRVSVTKNTCPAYRAVGQTAGHAFTLKNLGTIDVRYPGLVFEISASDSRKVAITSVVGGTALKPDGTPFAFNVEAVSHKFVMVPGADKTPLAAGASAQMTFFSRTMGVSTTKVKAYIDTTAIQDTSTTSDNSAGCAYPIQ